MRPAQVGWLLRRVRHGGRCYVLVRQRGRGRDALWLVAGSAAARVAAGGLRRLPRPAYKLFEPAQTGLITH
jgi:hypothetical protein